MSLSDGVLTLRRNDLQGVHGMPGEVFVWWGGVIDVRGRRRAEENMTSKVEKSVEVEAPVQRVYNQWTQFEQFPRVHGRVRHVKQLSDTTLHWVAKIAGVTREWDAEIWGRCQTGRSPGRPPPDDQRGLGLLRVDGPGPNRGAAGPRVDPEGFLEKVGDWLNIVSRRASGRP